MNGCNRQLYYTFAGMQTRELYLSEKVKNYAFNLRFRILAYLEEHSKEQLSSVPTETFHILGQEFHPKNLELEQMTQSLYEVFISTPWLTYRSGFPELYNELKGTYVTDTGWGCMIRVGQMLFAQLLKTNRNVKSQEEMLDIIKLFSDVDKNAPFSIINISKVARKEYGIRPGDWYNPSQISVILTSLYQEYMAKTEKMSIVVFNSGNLFFDQVIQGMLGQPVNKCQCIKTNLLICSKCNTAKRAGAVVILTRLGLDSPELKYLHVLEELMKFKSFRGVIGGKPKKALYFIGCHGKQYIYLDPHYVQDAEKDQKGDSYFCESFRKCKNTSIDASTGISFYFRDLHELNTFYGQIMKVKQECYDDFFIFVETVTPNYAKDSKYVIKFENEDEEEFQEL